jgi:hypothetical protein
MRFTPGPWELEYEEGKHVIKMGEAINAEEGYESQLEVEYAHCIFPGNYQFEEAQGNAQLMTAAPDMYEALATLLDEQNGAPLLSREKQYNEAVAKARAAIAKADGREPDDELS